jgi:hypothetical protein
MKRRFIVAIDGMTDQQESTFISYIQNQGLGWWHWIGNFWLLVSIDKKLNADEIRDKLLEIVPEKYSLVLEVHNSISWYGFGLNKPPKDMFNWIKETWHPDK